MINKIIISGNIAGCGKSTAAKYLTDTYGFKEFYFAEPIYKIAKEYFNMKDKNRRILQQIGEKFREIRNDVWVEYLFRQIKGIDKVCISDCRRENEFNRALEENFLHIRIVTDRDTAIKRMYKRDGSVDESLLDNASETGSRKLKAFEISNNGSFEDLYKQIDWIMQQDWNEYIKNLQMEFTLGQMY